jgi:2'-5' RNA ligase
MAALMFTVPEETSRVLGELPVPGKPERAHLHITVVYLGDDTPIERIGQLLPVLYEVTSKTMPFSVSTDLITTFPAGKDGVPVIAKVRSPELHAFQQALRQAMDEAGIEYNNKFPVYKPHVTLAYAKDPDTLFEADIPEISWPAHELLLWGSNRGVGRLVVKFPLSLPMSRVASEGALQRATVQLALWGKRDRFV